MLNIKKSIPLFIIPPFSIDHFVGLIKITQASGAESIRC
jgi:hypothetical protein